MFSFILILFCNKMGPSSNLSTIFIILIPVSLSKFIIDLWIGAAPLHMGSKDSCILIKAFLVNPKNSFGIIWPYATTIAKSALNSFKNL